MEENINAWIAKNRDTAAKLGLKIKDYHKEFVNVKVGGYRIQLTMPPVSDFEDTVWPGNTDPDCVFVALSTEEEDDETLMNNLEALNEKLERVRITPGCVDKVFDIIAQVFGRNSKKQKLGVEQVHQPLKESYLYRLVENARLQCDIALAEALEYSKPNGILPQCSIKLDSASEAVELQMEIKGIITPDHVTKALGFCFDHPLKLNLTFDGGKLYEKEASLLGSVDVFVKQNTANILQLGDSVENLMSGMDERIKHAVVESCIASMRPYGPSVLVPQFVKEFMHNIRIGPDNIFIDLLLSLGSWLRMLKNWCVVCRSPLPSFSRLWYCDAELWNILGSLKPVAFWVISSLITLGSYQFTVHRFQFQFTGWTSLLVAWSSYWWLSSLTSSLLVVFAEFDHSSFLIGFLRWFLIRLTS